jgi:hypothetical protein
MPKKQSKKKIEMENHLPIEGPGRDDLMQLYEWSIDDAMQAQEEWQKKGAVGRGPLFRWVGAQKLKELFEIYRTSKKPALIIEALYICSINSLPMPRWCERGYLAAYREVRQFKAESWDDVFGRPHKKGIHLDRAQLEREKSLGVYLRIKHVKEGNLFGNREQEMVEGIPVRYLNGRIKWFNPSAIGEKLFERIGKEFNVGKTLAEEYYYKWKIKLEKKTIT